MSYSFPAKTLFDSVRQPTGLAILASIGVHLLIGWSWDLFPLGSKKADPLEPVGLLELNPEEISRLPNFDEPVAVPQAQPSLGNPLPPPEPTDYTIPEDPARSPSWTLPPGRDDGLPTLPSDSATNFPSLWNIPDDLSAYNSYDRSITNTPPPPPADFGNFSDRPNSPPFGSFRTNQNQNNLDSGAPLPVPPSPLDVQPEQVDPNARLGQGTDGMNQQVDPGFKNPPDANGEQKLADLGRQQSVGAENPLSRESLDTVASDYLDRARNNYNLGGSPRGDRPSSTEEKPPSNDRNNQNNQNNNNENQIASAEEYNEQRQEYYENNPEERRELLDRLLGEKRRQEAANRNVTGSVSQDRETDIQSLSAVVRWRGTLAQNHTKIVDDPEKINIENIDPIADRYPAEACANKLEGKGTIGVFVDDKGAVIDGPRVLAATGHDILDGFASNWIEQQSFEGTNRPTIYVYPFSFTYNAERCRTASDGDAATETESNHSPAPTGTTAPNSVDNSASGDRANPSETEASQPGEADGEATTGDGQQTPATSEDPGESEAETTESESESGSGDDPSPPEADAEEAENPEGEAPEGEASSTTEESVGRQNLSDNGSQEGDRAPGQCNPNSLPSLEGC
ncbi:hypothetical protein JJD41_05550 [Oxynema sp. CENA135]|uniref:hypothetical protein n=1 Tax=Oxynema sp. CENA135 TaxID=984206 RepID=UPI00190DD852|nr:hypothetical protein [Oxynema sp. CENA135]MBK4729352.1 hypothetical protein [Oxynema sp. CENA135]